MNGWMCREKERKTGTCIQVRESAHLGRLVQAVVRKEFIASGVVSNMEEEAKGVYGTVFFAGPFL